MDAFMLSIKQAAHRL